MVICIAVLVGGVWAPGVAGAKYVVASDIPWFPFEMVSGSGEFFGFDLDVIRAIAVVAGFDVEIINYAFDVIIDSVKSGEVDLGVAGFTITEEREARIDFSEPYYLLNQSVLIRKDSGLNVATALGGQGPNKAVGAASWSTGFYWVQDEIQGNQIDVQLKGYETWDLAVLDLVNKRIDAVICDEFVAKASLADHPDDLTVAGVLNINEYIGFLVAEKDPKGILPGINAAMVALGLQVIERAGGVKELVVTPGTVWDNLLKAYFGPKPDKIEAAWLAAKGLLLEARDLPDIAAFASKLAELATGSPSNESPAAALSWQALSSSGARLLVEPRTGDRIRFDASGSSDPDGRIVTYEWDWESDGSYDTNETSSTIEHTFSTSGSHRVTLQVTDDQGATGSVTQTVNVGERQAPQALFAFSPTQLAVADAVHFTDQSGDPDGQVVSWKWEFGDGTTSAERNPTHAYSRKGAFTVKLTVTDNDGLTGTKSQTLTAVNLPPDVSFSFEPQTPGVGQSTRFDGSASTDRDGTISSYAWDFNGDGKTDATGVEATWSFVEAKTHTVTLSVVDSDGTTGTANKDVTVSAAPSGPPRFQQQWGLVIGVGNYEDPAISDLAYTEADAQAFYDFLTNPQGGGLQKDHVRFLLNEQATTASVKAAFRWLISQAGVADLVVIYFAVHGGTGEDVTVPPDEADGVDEYLITYDAQKTDLFSTAVRDDEIADWLASFRCDNVVVILDSCFAAGATRSLEQTGTRAGPGNRVFNDLVGPGRLFLAASQEDEFSYEDPALGHGVFTYYLLRGLGAMEGVTTPEADADQDGRVTVEELRIYLEREVTRAKPPQHPLVTGDLALTRVALDGYGEPLIGEVTAIQGDYVIVSLGSRHGVQVGDQFEIVRPYILPDGSTAAEVRALIQIASILGPDRAACVLIESHFPVEIGDSVRPAQ